MTLRIEEQIIDFPLKGEWIAPNTPGKRIPSHGTHEYAETYAYDFVGVKSTNRVMKFYDTSIVEYLLKGVRLEKCYSWGKSVYSPCDGEIVKAEDGTVERKVANFKDDLKYVLKVSELKKKGLLTYKHIAGNHVVMKCKENVYALFAHLKTGSITVTVGEKVKKGQIIGEVGHSGNSMAPHLHFQMMDKEDPGIAKGILCSFEEYEVLKGKTWIKVKKGIPKDKEIIRR